MKKGDQFPTIQEEVLYRTKDVIQLFDAEVVNNINPHVSDAIECAPFRKFGIYIAIDSTSTPDLLQIEVEFLDRWTGKWFSHRQGPFASLFWEDADTASGIYECFTGDVLGRAIRVKLTGVDVASSGNTLSSTKYFTVSVSIDLWN